MKKIVRISTKKFLFCLLFLSISLQQYGTELPTNADITTIDNTVPSTLSTALIDKNHQPTRALLQLLELMNVSHDGSLESIFSETQKVWLRQAGQERWENKNSFMFAHDNIPQLFEDLFLTQEIKPTKRNYTHALLLGATVSSVRNRLSYLIKLWNEGVRFETIVILAGKRQLDTTIESAELLLNNTCATLSFKKDWHHAGQLPTTETEMIQLIFDQTELPEAWKNIPIIFVDTPMQPTEQGTLRRPNTQDTIDEWIRMYHPKVGSILAISNQPFVGYQDTVLRRSLSETFTIDTVGSAHTENSTIATIFDSLARWIYNEYQLLESVEIEGKQKQRSTKNHKTIKKISWYTNKE